MKLEKRKPRGWIKAHSWEIVFQYLRLGNKAKTGREFGITGVGVERALFYEDIHNLIAPAHLRHFKGEDRKPKMVITEGILPRLAMLEDELTNLEQRVTKLEEAPKVEGIQVSKRRKGIKIEIAGTTLRELGY